MLLLFVVRRSVNEGFNPKHCARRLHLEYRNERVSMMDGIQYSSLESYFWALLTQSFTFSVLAYKLF